MNARTTIIIVNWNGEKFLPALLDSISAAGNPPAILIDNASTDSSLKVLQTYSYVTTILNQTNRGFGAAANQGIKQAATEFILLLNADTQLRGDAIQALESFMDQHPDASVVAPKLIFPDGRLQLSCRRFPTIFRMFMYLSFLDRIFPTRYRLKEEELQYTREVEQPMGAALMLRKSVLDSVKGFDEEFFMYMEDVDLCERILKRSGKIYFFPGAEVVHAAGGSSNQDWKRSQINFANSLLMYFRKRSGILQMFILKFSIILAYLIRSAALFFVGRWRQSAAYLHLSIKVLQ